MAYPRFQRARAHRMVRKTAAVDNIASTTYVALEADGSFDQIIEAQIGDTLKAELSGTFGAQVVSKTLEAATLVGGSPLNYFGTSTTVASHGPWFGVSGATSMLAGSRRYVVQSGDIDANGKVTVRIMARGSSTTTWTPDSSADSPLDFYLDNIGPADPE